jgi:hypothetical protein
MIGANQGVVVGGPLLVEQLAFLVGSYSGSERMEPTEWAPGGTADTRVAGELDVDGLVLVQRQVQERAGVPLFRAVNVFMADPDGRVLLYPFDSVGFPPESPAVGEWQGEDLVFERSSPRGSARTTYTPTPDGYAWSKAYRAPDGATWQPMIEGTLVRS